MLFTAPKSLLKGENSERNIQEAALSLAKPSAAKTLGSRFPLGLAFAPLLCVVAQP